MSRLTTGRFYSWKMMVLSLRRRSNRAPLDMQNLLIVNVIRIGRFSFPVDKLYQLGDPWPPQTTTTIMWLLCQEFRYVCQRSQKSMNALPSLTSKSSNHDPFLDGPLRHTFVVIIMIIVLCTRTTSMRWLGSWKKIKKLLPGWSEWLWALL